MKLTSQQTQTSAGEPVQLFQAGSPFIPCFHTHPAAMTWPGCEQGCGHTPASGAQGDAGPWPSPAPAAQGDAGHADSRAWPTCVLLCREMIYLNLPCVSRDRCSQCNAIQIKLGGTHLQSWDARLEDLPASSLPARAQPRGAGLAGASPAPVPPNKPAQSHFLLTDLLQNNGPCKVQPLQESKVASGIKKPSYFE